MFKLNLSVVTRLCGALVALVVTSLSHAQGLVSLDDIQFSSLPGQKFEVNLQFNQTPEDPVGYIIEQPARIVLDFPNTASNLDKKRYPLAFGNAESAIILTADDRTRIILNLTEASAYSTQKDGSKFSIVVGSEGTSTTTALTSTAGNVESAVEAPKPTYASGQVNITDVDFRRTEAGEGRVIIRLSDPSVNVDVEETASGIEVSFLNVHLPDEFRRRLDVTDFATPVSFIDTDSQAGVTKVKIDPQGDYEYLAYQADQEYVVSVKPLTAQEEEERRTKFQFVGEKLSLNFQDIEVRAVLQLIADFTDLNLVASDTVSGRITLRLENVPWDQALDIVLKAKGLDKRQIGNVLMVAPAQEIANRERQELETRKQLQELAPLRTEHIRILYANVKELFELFDVGQEGGSGSGGSGRRSETATASILSERGSAIIDERTNSVILTDTEDKIEEFKTLIRQIDIPIRQVLIEARIVTASTDFSRDLGVQWSTGYLDANDDGTAFVGGNQAQDLAFDSGVLSGDFGVVDLGAVGPAGDIAFGYVTDNFLVDLELSALESEGFGEVISQPKVVTGDKQTATIRSGSEVPFQQASSSGATTTAYREATLRLEVTPQITPDDHIILDLAVNQDAIGEVVAFGASSAPTIDVTEVITQVLVKNGETIVLGGIFQSVETNSTTKVPLLGDIPVVGNLFKRKQRDTEKNELLIFITPRLLEQPVHRQ